MHIATSMICYSSLAFTARCSALAGARKKYAVVVLFLEKLKANLKAGVLSPGIHQDKL